MITAIIIDDEKSGRETLQILLEKYFSQKIEVIGIAASVKEGVELIRAQNPQLVFLDMEMPNEQGLSIIKYFDKITFEIIITTAHRDYGIEGIKAGVSDYLLKPIDIDELEIALTKIETRINDKVEKMDLKKIINQVEILSSQKHKISLLINNSQTIFVEPSSIIRCEADGNYTKICFTNAKPVLITKLMKDVEELLADGNFLRIHKSHLINISHVKSLQKSTDEITMLDDAIIPLSRNVKAEFLKLMKI